jgi:nucleoside phosphorylase
MLDQVWDHVIMRSRAQSDIGIGVVTALTIECAAFRTVIDNMTNVSPRTGDPNSYVTGTMPSNVPEEPHRVALTVMPRDNNKNAAAVCVDLLRSFPGVRCVLMVGIAGGIPAPHAAERHVRLGDVVVATGGVVDYDHVRSVDGEHKIRRHLQGSSMELTNAAQQVRVGEHLGRRPWEDELLLVPEGFERPPESSDILLVRGRPVKHPDTTRSGHRPGVPKIHYAAIASADRLLRDESYRDELASRHHEIAAVEMEGSGIATATDLHGVHWFVIRGVADYCDNSKNSAWHAYAARAAAVYARILLAHAAPLNRLQFRATDGRGSVVALLLQIPAMADGHTRQAIVERLRPDIRDTIRRFPAARPDMHEILSTCLDHEGGTAELAAAITSVVGDSLSARRAVEVLRDL